MEINDWQAMKKVISVLLLIVLASCTKPIEKPKNLVAPETMSKIIADFAIGDQLSYMKGSGNMDISTRYILQSYHVKGNDFSESYKYYLTTKKLGAILSESQEIIKAKDTAAEDFIKKKSKEKGNVPPYAK